MVSKALKIRQSEGIELLCEIAFFRNHLTDVPLRPRLLAKRPVLDRRWLNLRRSCLSRVVVAKVQNRSEFAITPGTVLVREWDRRSQRVMVMPDGFAWNGRTYDSLSKVAFAITGTKWNGPRFFGLRDKEDRLEAGARS